MLVLTRRIGEKIVIDGEITITVLAIQGGKARLGIAAPPSIRVDRSEIRARLLESGSAVDANDNLLAPAPIVVQ